MISFILSVARAKRPARMLSPDGKRLAYRTDGGIGDLFFGAIFFGAGSFVLCAILWGIWSFQGPWWSIPIILLLCLTVGGTFTALGSWLLLGRSGMSIDKAAGTVETWWSLLFFRRARTIPLEGMNSLCVKHVGSSLGPRTYGVFLIGQGKDAVHVADATVSRQLAEEIAEEVRQFMALPPKTCLPAGRAKT
jgi:hypothetical protein